MNTGETGAPSRLAESESVARLIDGWTESLSQVFESMAGQRPELRWQPADAPPAAEGAEGEWLWWEQPFQIGEDAAVWVAAPTSVWEHAGSVTLKAAGLESFEPGEARNTWIEMLGQSLSGMARSAGALLGREVACEGGSERAPGPQVRDFASVSVRFGDMPEGGLALALSPSLLDLIAATSEQPEQPTESAPLPPHSRTMDLLLDIELPVSISFGKIQLPMRDVLKLTTGSIVELDRDASEPVDVLVNRCLVARGEVVVVEGNYGVRIQQIVSRQDRLRSVK